MSQKKLTALFLAIVIVCSLALSAPAYAESSIVTGEGSFTIGHGETDPSGTNVIDLAEPNPIAGNGWAYNTSLLSFDIVDGASVVVINSNLNEDGTIKHGRMLRVVAGAKVNITFKDMKLHGDGTQSAAYLYLQDYHANVTLTLVGENELVSNRPNRVTNNTALFIEYSSKLTINGSGELLVHNKANANDPNAILSRGKLTLNSGKVELRGDSTLSSSNALDSNEVTINGGQLIATSNSSAIASNTFELPSAYTYKTSTDADGNTAQWNEYPSSEFVNDSAYKYVEIAAPDIIETSTITEQYRLENGTKIQPDTTSEVAQGENCEKVAPAISGYELIGCKIDGGELQTGISTVFFVDIQKDYTITFIYEKALQVYIITERYRLEDGTEIQANTTTTVTQGADYEIASSDIVGYDYSGYEIDGGPLQTGGTVFLSNAQENHVVTFVYKEKQVSSQFSLYFENAGDTSRLMVTDDIDDNTTYEWFSFDETVATVSNNGIVTAQGPGRCLIRAERGESSYEVNAVVAENSGPDDPPDAPPEETEIVTLNDKDVGTGLNKIQYSGSWSSKSISAAYNGDETYANTSGALFQVSFSGTNVKWYGAYNNTHGKADVYIDDVFVEKVDSYKAVREDQALLFNSGTLAQGEHTLKVVLTGDSNSQSAGAYVTVDKIEIELSQGSDPGSGNGLPQPVNPKDPTINLASPEYRSSAEISSAYNSTSTVDKALDGILTTRWQSLASDTAPWLDVLFIDNYTFNQVTLRSLTNASITPIGSYGLQYKDPVTGAWVTFYTGGSVPHNRDVVMDFDEIVAAGVRIVITPTEANKPVSIMELQVRYV